MAKPCFYIDGKYLTNEELLDWAGTQDITRIGNIIPQFAVPDMPFKKTDQWVNLVLRRMMMYAAENGYDRIAWTTGEQQADRYDLSKQVDKVLVSKYKDGYTLNVLLPGRAYNNEQTLIGEKLTESQLEEQIGKDITQKVILDNLPLGQTNVYEGNDLKVGGEGMKAFYDRIVPKAAKKLAKPFGADVETIEIPETGKQQSLPINDKMKEVALQGMPLFSFEEKMTDLDERLKSATGEEDKADIVKSILDEIEGSHNSPIVSTVVKNKSELVGLLRMMGEL